MVGTVIRLLLIGNSLTAANGLPGTLEAMGRASGIAIRCTAIAKPNYSLEDHWSDGEARRAIARGGWSYVVLQQGPSALPESRVLLDDYVGRFDGEIRRAGGRSVIYMVWPAAARSGDFDGVSASYRDAAARVGGMLAAAGDAWRAAWRRDRTLGLYGPDGFHPSATGSYLAAMVIFRQLTGRLPARSAAAWLPPATLSVLEAAVTEVAAPSRPPLPR